MKSDSEKSKELIRWIVKPLLSWFRSNARTLPWRNTGDPYKVWLSEIMLQQTRVEAVKPYFERFVKAVPDIPALATLPEEKLLKLWEGLGYYSRVRNLQKGAKMVMADFGGTLPRTPEELRRIPGIGEYTSGAIASIAFERPEPAVDGNVIRVMTRLLDCHEEPNAQLIEILRKNLSEVYPPEGERSNFTQSLMELGAIVCLPGGPPKCRICPLHEKCQALAKGTIQDLPLKLPKIQRKREQKTILLLCCGQRIAIEKRPAKGVLASMWQFPTLEGVMKEEVLAEKLSSLNLLKIEKIRKARHIFTHLEWEMQGFFIQCSNPSPDYLWITKEEMENTYSLPSAFKAYREEALKRLSF